MGVNFPGYFEKKNNNCIWHKHRKTENLEYGNQFYSLFIISYS